MSEKPYSAEADGWLARRKKAIAIEKARDESNEAIWYQLCLKSVRTALGVGSGAMSAKIAWDQVADDDKYTGKLPLLGVPLWMDKPAGSKYGHIVLVASVTKAKETGKIEDVLVYSNDIKVKGQISLVSVGYLLRNWGMVYKGWATTLNGERIAPKLKHNGDGPNIIVP